MKRKLSKAMIALLATLGVTACANNNTQQQEETEPEKIVLSNEQTEEINDKLDLIMMTLSRELGRNVTKIKSISYDAESGIVVDITISDYNVRTGKSVDSDYVISTDDFSGTNMQVWLDEVNALAGHYAGNNVGAYTNLIDAQLKTIKTASDFTYNATEINTLDVSSISGKLVLQKLSTYYTEQGNFDEAAAIINFLKDDPDYSETPTASWAQIANADKTGFDYVASLVLQINNKNYCQSFSFSGSEEKIDKTMVEALKAYYSGEQSSLKAKLIDVYTEAVATSFVYVEEAKLIKATLNYVLDPNENEVKYPMENSSGLEA